MKIQVACPANTTTGGPEALHQLVDTARRLGMDARIVYLPLDKQAKYQPADPYRIYEIAMDADFDDTPDTLIVLPETLTWRLRQFRHARKAIWWLSIDNYFAAAEGERKKRFKHWLGLNRPFNLDRPDPKILHLAQSEYVRLFLSSKGISHVQMLTDYLRDDFLAAIETCRQQPMIRRKRIAYNPKKGLTHTERIVAQAPAELEFVRLENMTPAEVQRTLLSSAVYIDFGTHPGRDRIPREAAACGCTILTGLQGSAANPIDIPIPSTYKLNEQAPDFPQQAIRMLERLVQHHAQDQAAFDGYRETISRQKQIFQREVADLIAACA